MTPSAAADNALANTSITKPAAKLMIAPPPGSHPQALTHKQ